MKDLTRDEINDILTVVSMQYGYDFTGYSQASLKRRLLRFMNIAQLNNVFDFRYRLTNDSTFFSWFVQSVTVNVTEMFRDPQVYRYLRAEVLPKLASYPIIKIWHAGCSTGEEVFSLAIVLYELGLLGRAKIYATDLSPSCIEKASSGIISATHMRDYTQNYIQAGGKNDFSAYYTAKYDNAIINKELRKDIIFSQHNLVTDAAFNEFHMVCCRNVLIYFNRELQNDVIKLFYDSLSPLGYLWLGTKESLLFTDVRNSFETVSMENKIYRRKK